LVNSAKLNLTRTNLGIIFSKNGLSGQGKRIYADGSRDTAFSQLGIAVLDITLHELNGLDEYDKFLLMLQQKYEELRFRI
jgi:hypothetical protein